jgi:hypothetical protein
VQPACLDRLSPFPADRSRPVSSRADDRPVERTIAPVEIGDSARQVTGTTGATTDRMMRISTACLVSLIAIAGCSSDDDTGDDAPPTGPVYYGQVDDILNRNCASCHTSDATDRLAPFALETYDEAVLAAETAPIAYAVMERIMPPFYADDSGDCQTYKDNPWLTDDEIATLVAWSNGDRAMGNIDDASPPAALLPSLAQVDATLDPGVEFLPDQQMADDFRCFIIDPALTTDKFMTGYHVKPGNQTVVHHVIAYVPNNETAEAQAIALDDASPTVPGYECRGDAGVPSTWLVGWAPGGGAGYLPDGVGLRVPAGRKLVVQMHYNLAASNGLPDRTTIDLDFVDSVTKEGTIVQLPAPVNLPPGQPAAEAVLTYRIPDIIGSRQLWSAGFHMHQRGLGGTNLRRLDDGACLSTLVNWSFHWQHSYRYEQPITISGGETIQLTCLFDTTEETQTITWGEGTGDEMCLFIGLTSE